MKFLLGWECSCCSCGYNWVAVYVHTAHYKYVNCSFFEQYNFDNDSKSSPQYAANVLIRLIQLLQIPAGLVIKWFSCVHGLHMLVRTPYSIWACFWWDDRWVPGASPPRLGFRNQSAPGQSGMRRCVGYMWQYNNTSCPRGAWLVLGLNRLGPVKSSSVFIAHELLTLSSHMRLPIPCTGKNQEPTTQMYQYFLQWLSHITTCCLWREQGTNRLVGVLCCAAPFVVIRPSCHPHGIGF